MARTWCGALLAALAVTGLGWTSQGCGSSDDGKTVAGRTRSVAEVGSPTLLRGSLSLARLTEQVGGLSETALEVELLAPPEARSASLRTPVEGAAELALEARGGGRFVLAERGESTILETRFPPGAYTLLAVLPDGSLPTLSLDARGGFPGAPVIDAPLDMALGVPRATTIRWTAAPGTTRFDVVLSDAASGEVVHEARDLQEVESYQVPAGVLSATTRYRLDVLAASAPALAAVRISAGARVVFDTGADQ